MKEARLMRGLRHPNIVKFYGVAVCEQPVYLLIEFVPGGSLDNYLKKNWDSIDRYDKLQMISGAGWGLAYLHSNQIIHREIAARNCLYGEGGFILIYEVFSCFPPYEGQKNVEARKKILDGIFNTFPSETPKGLQNFVIVKMWARCADDRQTIGSLLATAVFGSTPEMAEVAAAAPVVNP